MIVTLPRGVTMTAEILQQIIRECGLCDPCGDGSGSGSGGSGSGSGSGSGDGIRYRAAVCADVFFCDPDNFDIEDYTSEVPCTFCVDMPTIPYLTACPAFTGFTFHLDNLVDCDTPPLGCTWNVRTSEYPDTSGCANPAQLPSWALYWSCSPFDFGDIGILLIFQLSDGGGTARYFAPVASVDWAGTTTLSLLDDTTTQSMPASIDVYACA